MAKLKPDFFLPVALSPIANCDNMRLFHTLREPEIISYLVSVCAWGHADLDRSL